VALVRVTTTAPATGRPTVTAAVRSAGDLLH